MDEQDLTTLAEAVRDGDEVGFRTLVESMTRPLIAMAYRYTRDWEWARDLTQETWIRVHERIGRYDPSRSFRSWLFTVHRNGCLDHLRRTRVRPEHVPDNDGQRALQLVPDPQSVEEDFERREFHERILGAVDRLSESQRQVFVRVDLEQGNQREVAEALGMNPTTLRTTLHHARGRIAGMLRNAEERS